MDQVKLQIRRSVLDTVNEALETSNQAADRHVAGDDREALGLLVKSNRMLFDRLCEFLVET